MTVPIDPAMPADAAAIAAVFGAARREAMPWLPRLHTEAEDRAFFTGVIEECEVRVVSRQDGIVAFLALKDDLVEHLYVLPEVQRAGIGSALVEEAKSGHPSGLQLWVFQRNHGARAFYARHGFVEVRLTDGSANEEREPDALLAWTP